MREYVESQTFRSRLPEVYYARVQDHPLLHAHESQRSNVHLCQICVSTNVHSSLEESRGGLSPSARPTFRLSASHLNLSSEGESEITPQ